MWKIFRAVVWPMKGNRSGDLFGFLAKVANLQYTILTAFKKYWPDIVAKFMSGTQETFIWIKRQKWAPVNFELEYMYLYRKICISFCPNILWISLITILYSILISEWIFWSKILKRKKDWNSMSNLCFLKYLWFLPG